MLEELCNTMWCWNLNSQDLIGLKTEQFPFNLLSYYMKEADQILCAWQLRGH